MHKGARASTNSGRGSLETFPDGRLSLYGAQVPIASLAQGIPRRLCMDSKFACHELNVSLDYKPVVQKARRTAPQQVEAVREEVDRLLKIGAVREVLYPQWLSNTVVVKKKNGKWKVCVDFTNLNRACPKDPFPLPKIDQSVDSTTGHERMSFLDAFQGYH